MGATLSVGALSGGAPFREFWKDMGGGLREWTYPRGSLPANSERLL